jgi:hypothetical protein
MKTVKKLDAELRKYEWLSAVGEGNEKLFVYTNRPLKIHEFMQIPKVYEGLKVSVRELGEVSL